LPEFIYSATILRHALTVATLQVSQIRKRCIVWLVLRGMRISEGIVPAKQFSAFCGSDGKRQQVALPPPGTRKYKLRPEMSILFAEP
jgi:hypothetical protein